jgi:hypothetical protein
VNNLIPIFAFFSLLGMEPLFEFDNAPEEKNWSIINPPNPSSFCLMSFATVCTINVSHLFG